MRVYWEDVRRGQNLMLSDEDSGREERIGGFRETKRGIDAYATTFGYDPGRSQKGFQTIEDAKAFVESFRPWDLYGAQDVTVEREVRPAAESAGPITTAAQEPSDESALAEPQPESVASIPEPEPLVIEPPPKNRWWEFWKSS